MIKNRNHNELVRFEQCALPHLDAAFNLARWLVGNESDAQDIVQEAYLRAFKYFDSFHGTDARGWLLTIVRNSSYSWLRQFRIEEISVSIDDGYSDMLRTGHEGLTESNTVTVSMATPETLLIQQANYELLRRSIAQLPVEFREVIVLRELEELSYKQIATITGVPVGTVMSRLARARKRLQQILAPDDAQLVNEDLTNEL